MASVRTTNQTSLIATLRGTDRRPAPTRRETPGDEELNTCCGTKRAGFVAYSFEGSELQKRSYPNSFGGQWQNKGYELIDELKLVENARRIGEEAVALHKADQCPEGTFDIILDSSQLGL